jgi:hypothetical protein
MLIVPNVAKLATDHWKNENTGYLMIGLGFFLICSIKALINILESYVLNRRSKPENEQLVKQTSWSISNHQLAQLITLVFALSVHNFFSM